MPGNISQELKQSEAKLGTVIDTIPVLAWRRRPDGSGEFWNGRWHDYTSSLWMPRAAGAGMASGSNFGIDYSIDDS